MKCGGYNFEERNICLCLDTCDCLKAFAILFVMIGHYYRYGEIISISGLFRSVGFFGAALFAFLSGYGTCISYLHKGFGNKGNWILKKIVKIYVPFLLVSFISEMTIYQIDGNNFKDAVISILFNSGDPIMWYIFFILAFNILFLFIFSIIDRNRDKFWIAFFVLVFFGVIQICISPKLGMGSQWYTSTGALLLGILFAKIDKFIKEYTGKVYRQLGIIFFSVVLLMSMVYVSKVYSHMSYLKDGSTSIAGMAFCAILFFVALFFDRKSSMYVLKPVVMCGKMSLWIYILHMKIMTLFGRYFQSYLVIFLITSLVSAYLLYFFNDRISCYFNRKRTGME